MKCFNCDTELVKRPEYSRIISSGFLGLKTKLLFAHSLVCLKCNRATGPFEEIICSSNIKQFPGHYNPPPPPTSPIPRVIVFQKKLNSQKFYDLMQLYRCAESSNQEEVIKRFEAIKEWLVDNAF